MLIGIQQSGSAQSVAQLTPRDAIAGVRQSHPAAVVIRDVLAKGRKALLIYGALHLQRRNIQTNYTMDTFEVQTPVSLIETATPSRVFVIWELSR